jgi:Flp pilus assembly protein TadG
MRRCGTSRAGRTFVARKNAVRRRASAAVWCSLAAFPILLMVAGVHDYARLLRSRADLERALDAAVLVGVRAPAAERAAIAGPLLAAGAAHAGLTLGAARWESGVDGSFAGRATASERLLFGSVLGLDATRIGAAATAQADGPVIVSRLTN